MSPAPIERAARRLARLYGEKPAKKVLPRLVELASHCAGVARPKRRPLTHKSAVLITYGDQVRDGNRAPLEVLGDFLPPRLASLIDRVHLLPFFPYSSDDGFAVIDYKGVDPKLGTWEDIARLGEDFGLLFDAVINHVSAESEWFKRCLAGDPEYEGFFISRPPDEDLSEVVRPRDLPLLTRFKTQNGDRWFWTTFSADQIDLDFSNLELLLRVIDVLLFYVAKGADVLRLDAIAFLWKKAGTPCIHLEETHEVIRLLRDILDAAAPHVLLLTETNVPHAENISYFGGGDEAQMVYQFSLPPLTAHAVLRGDAARLTAWARTLKPPGAGRTFFNFLASHDGIGMRPARGLLAPSEIEFLTETCRARGGEISYRGLADGGKQPYELNISYLDLLADPAGDEVLTLRRFLIAQAILLAMPGVPGIYFHSLFGSRNYHAGVAETGRARTINREKLELGPLERELGDPSSLRAKLFAEYRRLLAARAKIPAFDPFAPFSFPDLDRRVFAVERPPAAGRKGLLALHNVSGSTVKLAVSGGIVLGPYSSSWLAL